MSPPITTLSDSLEPTPANGATDPDGARTPAGEPGRGDERETRWRRGERRLGPLHFVTVLVTVVALAGVGALLWLTEVVSAHTDDHLLKIQTREAALVLSRVGASVRTPLDTAVAITNVRGGDARKVAAYVGHDVGTRPGQPFVSLSLWRLGPTGPVRLMSLGQRPEFASHPSAFDAFLESVPRPGKLAVKDLLTRPRPSLGYAVESIGDSPRYVVYAESAFPRLRRAVVPASSTFDQLGFALYLGPRAQRARLLESTSPHPSLEGPTAAATVAFGDSTLKLVTWAKGSLDGEVLPLLPWISLGVGLVLVAAGAATVEWLVRRRRTAELLARENRRLYAEQRSIAQTLQNALLPKELPHVTGVELAARYIPGDPAADIGGDWYDVIRVDDHSLIFAVGDVSGRGIPAANTMAALHFAIRAYAAQGDAVATILRKLATLVDVDRDGHFATVLLGHVDVAAHRMTLVNAGHLPPLVVSHAGAEYIETRTGAPVGVTTSSPYVPVSVPLPPKATVLAFTDGLVERRGEIIDAGLERLRQVAMEHRHDSHEMLDAVTSLATEGAGDDVALLALRWTT